MPVQKNHNSCVIDSGAAGSVAPYNFMSEVKICTINKSKYRELNRTVHRECIKAKDVRTSRKLNKKEKAQYEEIGQGITGKKTVEAIFERNCVSVKIKEEEDDWRGLYAKFSMTNHGCAANSVLNILNSEREISLVASRNIQKGEEIVMNYLDPYRAKKPSIMLRFERRSALKKFWNFNCFIFLLYFQ